MRIIAFLYSICSVAAFTSVAPISRGATHLGSSTYASDDVETETTDKGLFKRDRYVATNRFSVRRGQAPKFEKRWATRKSSLAKLDGFQYFHLMRRVNDNGYDEGDNEEDAFENYVSFTIWNKKSHFSAWRKGEAFKEAHGGTSIGAFLSTMVSSAMVLRGAPRPAFYDSLFLQKTVPTDIPETVDGWRSVEADGITMLPAECFVAFEKHFIPTANAKEFEEFWAQNKVDMSNAAPEFVASSLMRRDGQAKGHGVVEMQSNEPSYVSINVFKDRASYDSWAAQGDKPSVPASLARREPETVFYEGTLVISSAEGA